MEFVKYFLLLFTGQRYIQHTLYVEIGKVNKEAMKKYLYLKMIIAILGSIYNKNYILMYLLILCNIFNKKIMLYYKNVLCESCNFFRIKCCK